MEAEDELFMIERPCSRTSYYSSSSSTWYNEHFEIDPRTSPRQLNDPNTIRFADVSPVHQGSPHSALSSELYGEEDIHTCEVEHPALIATEQSTPSSSWELSLTTAKPWQNDYDCSLRYPSLGEDDDYLDVIEPLTAAAAEIYFDPPYPIENPFPSSRAPTPLTPTDMDDTDVNVSVSFSANDLVGTHPVSTSHITSARNMSIRAQTHIEDCANSKNEKRTFSQKLSRLVSEGMMGLRSHLSGSRNRAQSLTPSSQCCNSTPKPPHAVRRRYTLSIEVEVDVPVTHPSSVITSEEHHHYSSSSSSSRPLTLPCPFLPTPKPIPSDRTTLPLSESLPRDSVDTTWTTGTTVCIDGKPKTDGPFDKLLRRMKRRTWNGTGGTTGSSNVLPSGSGGGDSRRGASFALEEMTQKEMEELRRQMRRYST